MATLRVHLLPALGLALVVVAAFADVVFLGSTIQTTEYASGTQTLGSWGYQGPRPATSPIADPGCSAWQTDPNDRLIHKIYAHGDLPLWTPDEALGSPLAANMCCAAFSPIRIPEFLFPTPLVADAWALTRLFLAGLGAYLLARRRACKTRLAALAVGVGFMLSGYLVSYVNMWHMDAEIQLPWLALAFDRLVDRPGPGAIALAALGVLLSILVGQPESTFFVFAFVGLLQAHRILTDSHERVRQAGRFFAAMAIGHLLAALLLVPFVESLRECTAPAHSVAAGLHAASWKTALTLVAPRAFGPFYGKWNGAGPFDVATHVGAVTLWLALVALAPGRSRLATFLGVLSLVTVLKVFGTPGVNEAIGSLPAFSVSDFVKYVMPELALATVLLAGVGLDRLALGNVTPGNLAAASGILAASIALVSAANARGIMANGAYGPIALAFGYVVAATLAARFGGRRRATLLAVLLGVELVGYVPRERAARHEPFEPPPWVESLAKEPRPLRLLTLGHILHPNTGVVFGIDGVRAVEAMFPNRYYAVMKSLIPHLIDDRLAPGTESALLYRSRGILELLGIQYLVTSEDLLDPDRTREIAALARQGPANEAVLELDVPAHDAVLRFVPVLRALEKSELVLEVLRNGRFERAFAATLLPGARPAEASVDLGDFAGRRVLVRFSGRASWTRVTLGRPWTTLVLAHEGDARVYRNTAALPRAWVVHRSVVVPEENAALHAISSSLFDPRREVVLEGAAGPLRGVATPSSATVVRHDARKIGIECDAREEGYLVLADGYYPGWTATVDGVATPIVPGDVLFRAIRVQAGHHTVELSYLPPSFKIGVAVSVATALLLVVFLVTYRRPDPARKDAATGLDSSP